jgi:thiamine-phosphate pyrophosphorylase
MAEAPARLYLVTPVLDDAAAFAPRLAEACAAGDVAAVLVRLASADERTQIKRLKTLAPVGQEAGAAVLVSLPEEADLATISARGGADGVHASRSLAGFRELRERIKGDRILGAGGIRTRDDAMSLGELGAYYLMWGEPRADGSLPALDQVIERAAWWAEIFETPCVAFAPTLDAVPSLGTIGAEFIALGDAVWEHAGGPGAAVRAAVEALAQEPSR